MKKTLPHFAEATPGRLLDEPSEWDGGLVATVQVAPTQVRRPWRSTVRTVFQLVIALATLAPFVAGGIYDDVDQAPVVVVQVLTVAGTITRVMAVPQVEAFLRRWAPWLAAAPGASKNKAA